jgi:hypothetical protein
MTVSPTTSELRDQLTGSSLSFSWWSPLKVFEQEHLTTTADALAADRDLIRARNYLLDPAHPSFRALTSLKGQVRAHWQYSTFPYILSGVRLARRENVRSLEAELQAMMADAGELAERLDDARDSLLAEAKRRLGRLFSTVHYPDSFVGLFTAEHRERSVEPPTYLAHSNSEEYKRQLAQSMRDIEASLQKFEGECWQRLTELTGRLSSMLEESEGGKKRITEASLGAFRQLFDRTAQLNFQGSRVFTAAMAQTKQILDGVTAEDLRKPSGLRARVKADVDALVGKFGQLGIATVNAVEPVLASA